MVLLSDVCKIQYRHGDLSASNYSLEMTLWLEDIEVCKLEAPLWLLEDVKVRELGVTRLLPEDVDDITRLELD